MYKYSRKKLTGSLAVASTYLKVGEFRFLPFFWIFPIGRRKIDSPSYFPKKSHLRVGGSPFTGLSGIKICILLLKNSMVFCAK